jgi:hypothetical protein
MGRRVHLVQSQAPRRSHPRADAAQSGHHLGHTGARRYLGALPDRSARRTVLRSRRVRRAISLIESPSTKRIRRISAHCPPRPPTSSCLDNRAGLSPRPDAADSARGSEISTGARDAYSGGAESNDIGAERAQQLAGRALDGVIVDLARRDPLPAEGASASVGWPYRSAIGSRSLPLAWHFS